MSFSRRSFLKSTALTAASAFATPYFFHRNPALAASGTIEVGVLFSLTGGLSIIEKSLSDATRMAIEEINASGGVKGMQIKPLLEDGMTPEASRRVLYAQKTGNGVTGYVADTGRSYLCPDVSQDPLYLEGASGAGSSMTVPLKYQDEVIGTLNVESPRTNAFGPDDLQFTELFSREIATALVVTEAAVKQHLLRLYEKFGIHGEGERRRVRLANEAMARRAISLADLAELPAPGAR